MGSYHSSLTPMSVERAKSLGIVEICLTPYGKLTKVVVLHINGDYTRMIVDAENGKRWNHLKHTMGL